MGKIVPFLYNFDTVFIRCGNFLIWIHSLVIQRRVGFSQRRRMNERTRKADREDSIRRTVYVSDIDQHVRF